MNVTRHIRFEPLENRQFLSAVVELAAGAGPTNVEPPPPPFVMDKPVPIADGFLLQRLTGCWSARASAKGVDALVCVDIADGVRLDGTFDAVLTFRSLTDDTAMEMAVEGYYNPHKNQVFVSWDNGKTTAGTLVAAYNDRACTIYGTLDFNYLGQRTCVEVDLCAGDIDIVKPPAVEPAARDACLAGPQSIGRIAEPKLAIDTKFAGPELFAVKEL